MLNYLSSRRWGKEHSLLSKKKFFFFLLNEHPIIGKKGFEEKEHLCSTSGLVKITKHKSEFSKASHYPT